MRKFSTAPETAPMAVMWLSRRGEYPKSADWGSIRPNSKLTSRARSSLPGFIDSHSHADLTFLAGSAENEKLQMGVTTEIIGQCGFSAFPLSRRYAGLRQQSMAGFLPGVGLKWNWSTLDEYKAMALKRGISHHVAPLVGHGSVRQAVMGDDSAQPTQSQLDHMCRLVDEALGQGAHGVSHGTHLFPGVFFRYRRTHGNQSGDR